MTAPAACLFSRPEASTNPLEGRGYDLCFPLTAVPLINLRFNLPWWITVRTLRPLAVLPFLFPGNASVWIRHRGALRSMVGIASLFAFIPAYDLWWKPFAQWTAEDLIHPENLSLLLDLDAGQVLACPGVVHRDHMQLGQSGVMPFDQFAEEYLNRIITSSATNPA